MMRNIRLILSYDGTEYVGWQIQPNGLSVQAVVERAILKLTGEEANLLVAGRTDSGVHALGQVANFSTSSMIPCKNIQTGLQNFLPDDVVVRSVDEVSPEFHATYSAKRKRYRYVVHNSSVTNPFARKYAWHYRGELDVDSMHEAAQFLLGKHDFRCFESQFPNKATSVRTVMEATVVRYSNWPVWSQTESLNQTGRKDDEFIWFDIVADGFLYNMVRAIMGTLMEVGRQKWSVESVREIIENQDRSLAGETAPAHGLYLIEVDYE